MLKLKIWFVQFHKKNAFFFEKFPFWWFLNTGALSVFGLLFFVFFKKKNYTAKIP